MYFFLFPLVAVYRRHSQIFYIHLNARYLADIISLNDDIGEHKFLFLIKFDKSFFGWRIFMSFTSLSLRLTRLSARHLLAHKIRLDF